MSRLRVGVVGTGFIAGRHLAALTASPDVDVVAVADPVRERADAAAARCGARAHGDGPAFLGIEELDAVWLCVPPFAHGPLEAAAVARGLPFFVEKPLALDLATAETIAAEVARTGLPTAVGYHWRHLGSCSARRRRCGWGRCSWSPVPGWTVPPRRRGGRGAAARAVRWSSRPRTSSTWSGYWPGRSTWSRRPSGRRGTTAR